MIGVKKLKLQRTIYLLLQTASYFLSRLCRREPLRKFTDVRNGLPK